MKAFLALLALLLVAIFPQGADARAQHTTPTFFCPFGAGTADGCGQSPIVTKGVTPPLHHPTAFNPGDFFNTFAGTSANYMATDCGPSSNQLCRQPFNVDGVEYGIGNYTPKASLLDPAVSANLPTGCTYSTTTSGTGGGLIDCVSPFNGVLQHLELGPIGGHNCTAVRIDQVNSGITNILLDDLDFFNDAGNCIITSSFGFPDAIAIFTTVSGTTTLSNSIIDGNSSVFDTTFGSCSFGSNCNPSQIDLGQGNHKVYKYSSIQNFAGRPVQGDGAGGSTLIQYSWIQAWNSRGPTGHAQWFNGSGGSVPGSSGIVIDHSVTLQGMNISQFGPGPIFYSNNYPAPITNLNITNDTLINSFVGGMPKSFTVSGCQGAPPTGGTATNPSCGIAITSESWAAVGLGQATFNTSANPNIPVGGLFAVDGVIAGGGASSGFNGTYTALSGTTGTTVVGQLASGATLANPGSVSSTGTVSLSANTFYVSSQVGGTLGYGADLNCLSPGGVGPGTALLTYKAISGSYPISNGSAPSTINEFETDGFNGGQYGPTNFSQAAQCDSVAAGGEVANLAIAGGDGASPIGQATFTNNYVDVSSQSGAVNSQTIWTIDQVFNNQAVPFASASGTSLVMGSSQTLSTGELIYAADATGCSTSVLDCPTVITGGTSQPSFTVSSNSNIGPETLEEIANETSFNATVSGTTLTTSTSQTLTAGDFVYAHGAFVGTFNGNIVGTALTIDNSQAGAAIVVGQTLTGAGVSANTTITAGSGTSWTVTPSQTVGSTGSPVAMTVTCVNPTSCPTIVTTATGTTFTLSSSGGTVGSSTAMNTLRDTVTFNGTINNASPGAIATGSTLLTSVTLSKPNLFLVAPTITGCGGATNGGCPTITAGTGTSFTLSASVSAVGPIAVNLEPLAFCNSLSVITGNVDMTAQMAGSTGTAYLNSLSTPNAGAGLGTAPGCVGGFLSGLSAKFVVTNLSPNSNNFASGGGWTAASTGVAVPTVSTVVDTLPDGTTGNVSEVVFPSISAGTTNKSWLTYTDTNLLGADPLSHDVWARVVSGTGTLFNSISRGGIFADAAITNDNSWHLIQSTWAGESLGAGVNNVGISLGINQTFSTERTAVGPITVEFAGDYFVALQNANVPAFSDLKTGGDLAVTGSPPLQFQVTEPFPNHVAIRDPSKWTAFAGNPIVDGDPTEVWAAGGRGNPQISPQFQSGGLFWGWNGQCFSNNSNVNFIAQCLYSSSDGLNWTEDAGDPQLLLPGSILSNPTVSNVGSGFTAGTGTATYTGHTATCAIPPVIAVTVTGTTIASATPSPNNGIGTGSCGPWPTSTDTGWTFSGVGSGSGASFTFAQVIGTAAAPGPVRWELRPVFLPFGCSDGTNPHNFCIVYSGLDISSTGHLYLAWSDTVNGVYTPIPCAGPGPCSATAPVTVQNLPVGGYQNPGTPYVLNVGGSTGTNYIYVFSGRGDGTSGANYSIYTTSANKANTTSGNTLFFLQDAGFTLVSGEDWEQPTTGTNILDVGIFLNHCNFYEMYFVFENTVMPNPPWIGTNPDNQQIMGEAVSNSPTGPWYQYNQPVSTTNSGDPAPIELNGQFILTSTYNAPNGTGAGRALLGPLGTCP